MNKIDLYKKDGPVLIDDTGILNKYGFEAKPIIVNYRTLNKILLKHGISRADLLLIREQIESNLLIASSLTRDDSIVLFIGQWDGNDRPIMVSLNLQGRINEKNVYKITSIYGRNNAEEFIRRLINEDKLIYFDDKAYIWFKILGYDLPEINNVISDNIDYHGKYLISFCIIKN